MTEQRLHKVLRFGHSKDDLCMSEKYVLSPEW
jgi:hypothetical protein